MSTVFKIGRPIVTIMLVLATFYFYTPGKPILEYLEYLPVYRAELRWEGEETPQPTE